MKEVFTVVNSKIIMKLINTAEKEIVLVAPGIFGEIAASLVSASKNISPENITVILDPDINSIRYGYGDIDATETLIKNNIIVRLQKNIRIGIISTDIDSLIFTPTPQIIEEEPANSNFPNAIRISKEEVKRIINKINSPVKTNIEINTPEIGQNSFTEFDLKNAKKKLELKPPIKPDLARKMLVTSSIFQLISIHLEGTKIERRTFRLNAVDLGIKNPDLMKRISANYKILDKVEFDTLKAIDNMYQNILELFLIKIPNNESVILYENRKRFDKAIKELREKINESSKTLLREIEAELDKSKEIIIPLISSNLKNQNGMNLEQLVFPEKLSDESLNNYVKRKIDKRFPKANHLINEIKLKVRITNISDQLIDDPDFKQEIEKAFNKTFDEIVKISSAVGVKEDKLDFKLKLD